MKNTPELLPTCAGYNYALPSSPFLFVYFLSLYTPKWKGEENHLKILTVLAHSPCNLTPPWIASQLVLIFRYRSYRRPNF